MMDADENGGEEIDGTNPVRPCNSSYEWGISLSSEFLQEIARHTGVQSWGALRCVCQNWRRGISQAVRTVRLMVPDRSTAPAVQPPAEPPAVDAPRPARRGAAAGRPAGRGAAAAVAVNHQQVPPPPTQHLQHQQQEPPVPTAAAPLTQARRNEAETSQEQPEDQERHHPEHVRAQPHHNQQPQQQRPPQQQQPATTTGRGFAASSGRPPLPHPYPPDVNGTAALHKNPNSAVIPPTTAAMAPSAAAVGPESAAATAAAAGGGGGDASFGRIAAVVRRPPVFEPHHDLEPLACVFNLHRQSTVAAVAAAAAAAAARMQGEASDSQAAGVASSVGSSSIVVWSLLEAADKLAAAFPMYDNLSLNFAEPLPLAACGGGGEVGSGRWLQLEMSAALRQLLSERLVSLTLSGHTPYPLFMAPPPQPLPPSLPAASARAPPLGLHPSGLAQAFAGAQAAVQPKPPRQHHRLQRSSKRPPCAAAGGAAAATAAAVAAVAATNTAQGREMAEAAGGAAAGREAGGASHHAGLGRSEAAFGGSTVCGGGAQAPPPPPPLLPRNPFNHASDHHDDDHVNGQQQQPWQLQDADREQRKDCAGRLAAGVSAWPHRQMAIDSFGNLLTVADALKALEDEMIDGPTGLGPGSGGEACGGAPNRRRRRPSPAADAAPSTTAPPAAPYTGGANKSMTPPSEPPAQRQCREGGGAAGAAVSTAEVSEPRRELASADHSPGAAVVAPQPVLQPLPPPPGLRSPAAATANGYRGSSGSAPSHGSLGPRRHAGDAVGGYGTWRDADGSDAGRGIEAVGERGGSGVPNTPGRADGCCCCCFEVPSSGGGSGGSAGGGGDGDGEGGGGSRDAGDGGAALAVLAEANGSGRMNDRSPAGADDGGGGGGSGLIGPEYGADPMDTSADAQVTVGFGGCLNNRSQPNAATAALAAAMTTDAMIVGENSQEDAGGSGGTPNGGGGGGSGTHGCDGGGGSSDGNGSRRGGCADGGRRTAAAGAVQARKASSGSDDNPPQGLGRRYHADGAAAAAPAANAPGDGGGNGCVPAAAGQLVAPADATEGIKSVACHQEALAGAEAAVAPRLAQLGAVHSSGTAAATGGAGAVAVAPPLPQNGGHLPGAAGAEAEPSPLPAGGSGDAATYGNGGGGARAPPLLSRLSHLVSLTLSADVRFPSPQHLEAITALRGLQRLDIRGAKFMQADGDASSLGRQAWLHLGNDHVAVVARCTSLTSLSLNHLQPVGGAQLVALTALSRLTSLSLTDALSGNAVHGSHIKTLALGLTGLRSLDIGRVTCPPPPQQQQEPPSLCGGGTAPGAAATTGVHASPLPTHPPFCQAWGPVLGLFQHLTSLHLQVACSFETELLSGVAALPLLESFSMELLDVPPPQLAAMLDVLTAGPAGSGGAGGGAAADSGSPAKAAAPPPPPHGRHGRRAGRAAADGGGLSRVLRGLTLTACMLYDEHLELIGGLRQLRCIRLDQVDIRTRDPDGWTALSGARALESFHFRVWNNPVLSASNLCVLTNDSLAMMAANWPKLQQLNYSGKVDLTEKAEEHIARMTSLTSLDIVGTDGTSFRLWRSAADGQLRRSVTLPYNTTAKVSSRNGYVTFSDSDDSAKSEGSEASVNWMGEVGYVTSEYDAD